MDPTVLAVFALVIGLLIGLGAGWYLCSRPIADLKVRLTGAEAAGASREAEFKTAIKELGDARIEVGEKDVKIATLEANAANHEKEMKLLREAKEELSDHFKSLGAEALRQNREDFLKQAGERFRQSEEMGEARIRALLDPVGKRLEAYEKQVSALEEKRTDAFGRLYQQIDEMQRGQEGVRREAQRLGDSLKNLPKARGRWGERALQNVLEQCGLSQHTDFFLEQSTDSEDGRLRPDAIVRIPGGKILVIDSKVSLNAYQAAFEIEDTDGRNKLLNEHAKAMKGHVTQLASKGYQSQFDESPDYVVMFVPGEHFVAAALEQDPELWDFAFEKRVLLTTPTNLVALARTIAQVWRQQDLAREAQEIGRLGSELYDRLAKVTGDIANLGTHLNRAIGSYNTFTSSFETRVVVSARKMSELGIELGNRDLEELRKIDSVASLPKGGRSVGDEKP